MIVLAACGSDGAITDEDPVVAQPPDSSNLIVVPDSTGRFMADTIVQCGGPPSFRAGALENPVLLADSTVAEGALDVFDSFMADGEGAWWPQDGYWVLTNEPTELLLAHIGTQGEVTLIGSELADGTWQATAIRGGGPCPIQVPLPPDMSEVGWRVDPNQPYDETSTAVSLLATGQSCSSGQPMNERLRDPQVHLTPDAVYVVLVADVPDGAQTCPGNPVESVTVELGEAIGTRELVNARVVTGSLGDYLPISPCGQIDLPPSVVEDDEPVALDGPPPRTEC